MLTRRQVLTGAAAAAGAAALPSAFAESAAVAGPSPDRSRSAWPAAIPPDGVIL
jgi:hypothetical protein